MAIQETEDGWAYYFLEIPGTRKRPARSWEYAIPTVERERSAAHKIAIRKLERLAILHGVKIEISRRRKLTF